MQQRGYFHQVEYFREMECAPTQVTQFLEVPIPPGINYGL